MFMSPGDHQVSVSLLYFPRRLLVDLGFGSLLDRLDKDFGKRTTTALTFLLGLAAGAQGLRLFIEALIWVFRAIRTGGESIGLMTLQDWAAFVPTASIGVAAVFVLFVIFDRLWITKRVNATRHDVERMLHRAEASEQRTQAEHDEISATVNEVKALQAEVMARQAKLLHRFDDGSS